MNDQILKTRKARFCCAAPIIVALAILILFSLCVVLARADDPLDHFAYLPMVAQARGGRPTPTPAPTPTPTAYKPTDSPPTPTPTVRATHVPSTPFPNGDFEQGLDRQARPIRWTDRQETASGELPGYAIMSFLQGAGFPSLPGQGEWFAWLGGFFTTDATTWIAQEVVIPQDAWLCFDYLIYSTSTEPGDEMRILLDDAVLLYSQQISARDSDERWDQWHHGCLDVTAWQGQTMTLKFEMFTDRWLYSDIRLDNVSFTEETWARPTSNGFVTETAAKGTPGPWSQGAPLSPKPARTATLPN